MGPGLWVVGRARCTLLLPPQGERGPKGEKGDRGVPGELVSGLPPAPCGPGPPPLTLHSGHQTQDVQGPSSCGSELHSPPQSPLN